MKRKFAVILLLFALILTSSACAVLQPNERNISDIEKQDTNGAAQDEDDDGDKDTDKGAQNSETDDKNDVLEEDSEEYIKSIIEDRAANVLTAIKNYDVEKLADAVHPDKESASHHTDMLMLTMILCFLQRK